MRFLWPHSSASWQFLLKSAPNSRRPIQLHAGAFDKSKQCQANHGSEGKRELCEQNSVTEDRSGKTPSMEKRLHHRADDHAVVEIDGVAHAPDSGNPRAHQPRTERFTAK